MGIAKMRKVDGTTETELGSAKTEDVGIGAGDPSRTTKSITVNMEIDVSSSVIHFKAGETLRMTIEVSGRDPDGNDTGYMGIGIDPNDRNDIKLQGSNLAVVNDIDPTTFEVHIPFVLDL